MLMSLLLAFLKKAFSLPVSPDIVKVSLVQRVLMRAVSNSELFEENSHYILMMNDDDKMMSSSISAMKTRNYALH